MQRDMMEPAHLTGLRLAAEGGDSAAKADLAQRLLTQPPYSLQEGAAWAVAAAREGNPQGAHIAALLSAWGLGLNQDWQAALHFLEIAARGGHESDARVLAGLAGQWQLARDLTPGSKLSGPECAALRQAVRMEALLACPTPRVLSHNPRIFQVAGFLAPAMCDWLTGRALGQLVRAQVYDPASGAKDAAIRTNTELHIGTFDSDLILMLLQHRIAAVTGLPLAGMEACSILHYSPGEEFRPHHDFFDTTTPENARIIAAEGQRVLTFLVYLNDDYSGGETEFPYLRRRFRGGKGDALYFWNITPDFLPDRRTLHAGLAPASGEKWLFSQWIRARLPAQNRSGASPIV
jgi:prolyl 4-hydroxylase